ncbi:MAG TPA: Fic family protein [Bacilli bacterium]|nr:MAG: Adenosine monophosphate-protein transferase SoFic [Tenericutes bacterium ADurb.BinA124]HPX84423.1 Fic family protein [Bacilli bacterium]
MKKFNYSILKDKTWDIKIINYLTKIHEEKGKQQLFLKQKPEKLEKLVIIAKIQSTESSNEIEGIRTTNTRLKQLVNEKTTPRNRDEQEIAGYRDVLNIVHENFDSIPITPNFILQLHKVLLSHTPTSYGGKYKNVQNYISATNEKGETYTLFTPLSPFETPIAMQELCDEYNRVLGEGIVDPLILIPIFIHDFLCIHPFTDGNGRMSRLLTTLLLYRSGYFVGKYISLEAKIAKNKDLYYDALYDSQIGWHENNDDATPFIKYILSTIVSAYNDFEERVELVSNKKPSIEVVRMAVSAKLGKFTKRDILELVPSLSSTSIERNLKELCDLGEIKKEGIGKSTYYIRLK